MSAAHGLIGLPERTRPRNILFFLGYIAWCAFVLWAVGDALRHNDEAAYINGALQIAQGKVSPWHADLFNYDKQYASYWLIAGLLRLVRFRSVVLVTNYAQAIVFCLAFGAVVFGRLRRVPIALALPLVLCPILVLSVPFVETGMISLAFLMFGFAVLRRGRPLRQALACLLIAIAAACRADLVLAVPALILTEMSRRKFRGLLTSPLAWSISLCSILPPLFGELLTPRVSGVFQGNMPFFKVVAAFVVFGLGLGLLVLLLWSSMFFLAVSVRKPAWRGYYVLRALSPLIPLMFYVFLLQTPQQFFLTIACYMFTIAETRSRLVFSWLMPQTSRGRLSRLVLYLSAIVPWFVGITAPSLLRIRPTIASPQEFPTSHGHLPMGGYGFYLINGKIHADILDHNDKIFLAAKAVGYQACNGVVPVLNTPMYNFLELAVRLDHQSPKIVNSPDEIDCPHVYADARSLILDRRVPAARRLLRNASLAASFGGQAILSLGRSPTDLGLLLQALFDRYAGREFGFYALPANSQFDLQKSPNGGAVYALSKGECAIAPDAFGPAEVRRVGEKRLYAWNVPAGYRSRRAQIACVDGGQAGETALTFPGWMGKSIGGTAGE
jgi:hypothetical protein